MSSRWLKAEPALRNTIPPGKWRHTCNVDVASTMYPFGGNPNESRMKIQLLLQHNAVNQRGCNGGGVGRPRHAASSRHNENKYFSRQV